MERQSIALGDLHRRTRHVGVRGRRFSISFRARALAGLLLTVGLLGCGSVVHADPPLPAVGLVALFDPPPDPIASSVRGTLVFTVENRGPAPATIDLDQLGSAIFALDVMNAAGERVLTIPPGVPPTSYVPRTETLAVGARRRFEVTLHVFSPPLPAGDYTARVRTAGITSETLRFRVSPGGSP